MSREFIDGMDRLSYLRRRQEYIGGADAAGVLGASPFDTRYEVWHKKVCDVETLTELDNEHIRRGVFFEPIILRLIQGKEVYGQYLLDEPILPDVVPGDHTRHDEYEFIGGTPDGMVEDAVVEIKAPKTENVDKIRKEGLPDYWYFQAQHYCLIFDKRLLFFVFDYNRSDLLVFEIEPDYSLHDDMLFEYEMFWEHVVTETPPSDVGLENPAFKSGVGTDRLDELAHEYFKAHNGIKQLKKQKKQVRPVLMERLRGLDSVMTDRYSIKRSTMTRNDYTFPVLYVSEREDS